MKKIQALSACKQRDIKIGMILQSYGDEYNKDAKKIKRKNKLINNIKKEKVKR